MTQAAIDPCARELTRLQLLRHARLTCGHSIEELEMDGEGRGSHCKACVQNLASAPALEHELLVHAQAIRAELRRPARTLEGMPLSWLTGQAQDAAMRLYGLAHHAAPASAQQRLELASRLAALAFLISREIEGGRT